MFWFAVIKYPRGTRSRRSNEVRMICFCFLLSTSWMFSSVLVGFILRPAAFICNSQQLQGYVILRLRKPSGKRDSFPNNYKMSLNWFERSEYGDEPIYELITKLKRNEYTEPTNLDQMTDLGTCGYCQFYSNHLDRKWMSV